MKTPIVDFVRAYAESGALRCHMPGHKGQKLLGFESVDITEIKGADSLYEAEGIIKQSEENASALFGCPSFYSTEGSSQCIRAMVYLALLDAEKQGKKPLILAARNVHKTFLSAAALLDVKVKWLYGENEGSYLSCKISSESLEAAFRAEDKPTAVYITSPDYLGNTQDVEALAKVCRRNGALLLVDNAHGAYLKFLPKSRHPMDLGADLCCDSAHKTLPALTGAAYLHVRSEELAAMAKQALLLFGSTSPSYLILQSLDMVNKFLSGTFREALRLFSEKMLQLKENLRLHGYTLAGDEEIKLSISAKPYGYTGQELGELLEEKGIIPEFYDRDYLVLMLSCLNSDAELDKIENSLLEIPKKAEISEKPPVPSKSEKGMELREATLSLKEEIPVDMAEGRILASAGVGCPPAVPIVCCGEIIDRKAIECFKYYGIETVSVVK